MPGAYIQFASPHSQQPWAKLKLHDELNGTQDSIDINYQKERRLSSYFLIFYMKYPHTAYLQSSICVCVCYLRMCHFSLNSIAIFPSRLDMWTLVIIIIDAEKERLMLIHTCLSAGIGRWARTLGIGMGEQWNPAAKLGLIRIFVGCREYFSYLQMHWKCRTFRS